jgi:hypothetical protein
MQCKCSFYQRGYGHKEWYQEFEAVPRKGDRVIGSGMTCFVNYCVHEDGEPVKIVMEDKE